MNKLTDLSSPLIPDDAAFERMEHDLFQRIDAEEKAPMLQHVAARTGTKRPPRRVTRRRWAGVMAAAAAVVTVTLLATNLLGPKPATAEAAEVLRTAAAATIKSSDPIVGPGEYLAVDMTEVAMASGNGYAHQYSQRMVLFVPQDRSGVWVESRQDLPAGKKYGNVDSAQAEIDSSRSNPGWGDVRLYEGKAGQFVSYGDRSGAKIASLPTDTDKLLAYLYDQVEAPFSKDEHVFMDISDLLRSGLAPAAVRAALYEAIARVPGVYLSEGQANLDGRTGVAISRKMSSGEIEQIIIDPSTGLVIGMRGVLTEAAGFLPAGTVLHLTSVKTAVVAEAPTGPFREQSPPG